MTEIIVTDVKAGEQPEVALNPAGWLRAVHGVLGGICTTSLPALEPDDGHWDPMSDVPFTVWERHVSYPLQTYGLSTACSGGELARATGGVPVRGCAPSPLSSSIR